jgi:phosphonate transport system ATP-binding protein
VLELRDVCKSFGSTRAVDHVSLSIPAGAMVGVIGRSGAGKSSLLRVINRLVEPDAGEIFWKGEPVLRMSGQALRNWRRRAAMIFQQFQLAPRLDVLTNVLVGALHDRPLLSAMIKHFPAELRARAIRELEALDMAQAALQRAQTLSGGQQQRVAIARALMQSPDLLLADEPISSLDVSNANTVMCALQTINRERGITVIVNLHTLGVARRFCDRIIGMSAGRVVFDGSPAGLTSEVLRDIYRGPSDSPERPFDPHDSIEVAA